MRRRGVDGATASCTAAWAGSRGAVPTGVVAVALLVVGLVGMVVGLAEPVVGLVVVGVAVVVELVAVGAAVAGGAIVTMLDATARTAIAPPASHRTDPWRVGRMKGLFT